MDNQVSRDTQADLDRLRDHFDRLIAELQRENAALRAALTAEQAAPTAGQNPQNMVRATDAAGNVLPIQGGGQGGVGYFGQPAKFVSSDGTGVAYGHAGQAAPVGASEPVHCTVGQLCEAVAFADPDGDCEPDTAVILQWLPDRMSVENEPMAAGLYMWLGDYPEEGCIGPLESAAPSPQPAVDVPPQICQPEGLMFDALGEPRTRYVRVTLAGSHCVMHPSEGDTYLADARANGDDAPYVVRDVYLSEREFDDLPEHNGF